MSKINVDTVAAESQANTFNEFVENFQENIQTLEQRQAISQIKTTKKYQLDEDGFIIGDGWSEGIASEVMTLNGFISTSRRLEVLVSAREIYGQTSISSDHKLVSSKLGITSKEFLKLFPKYPIVYFTRWGNLRKPFNLDELIANPILK